ncbi:hypothetical protein [Flavobacterium sp.]|uniref:GapS4a family protein n=1 Tax=Flavobacterium sp. TaxID=239 RepID=UPI00286B07E9|nr:hypothetical protein [Flavobacterium sp.]
MGEKSKLIGEYGEKSVENFLKLIGWGEPPKGNNFKCTNEAHISRKTKKQKQTHGIDFFYAYKSPLVDSVLKKVNISVKYSNEIYPNSPNSKFKEHFEDLVTAIECFKFAPESKEIIKSIKGYSNSEDIGVLFWLTNNSDSYNDLIPKLSGINLTTEFNYNSLYIVDNKRIDFIYLSLKYAISKFTNSDINFFYPDTGKNIIPTTKKNFGKILPVEFLNTSILPLRIEDEFSKQTTLALFTIDPFDGDDLKRLISLSQELSKSWPSKILICFPDYNEVNHSREVRIAKNNFEDAKFTNNISVESFNDNFKSLQI